MDKRLLREQAKKKYKEMMKSVPKKQRPPFKQVYPMIKAMLVNKNSAPIKDTAEIVEEAEEGLLNDMFVNLNEDDV